MVVATTVAIAADIDPEPNLQAQIAAAGAARSDAELEPVLVELRKNGGVESEKLIPQLVYTLVNATDDSTAMAVGIIVQRLPISQQQLRAALLPYRSTTDPRLKRQIDNLLDP